MRATYLFIGLVFSYSHPFNIFWGFYFSLNENIFVSSEPNNLKNGTFIVKLFVDCYPCILRQALSTTKLVGLDDQKSKVVLDETMKMMLEQALSESPQQIIVRILDLIRTRFFEDVALFDPYEQLKKESNNVVLKYFDYLESFVLSAGSPLETAVKKAAAGNIIDFGAKDHGSIDIKQEIQNIPLLKFSIYDFKPFSSLLQKAKNVLYIGDNAGEIVFDRILIRHIKRMYPDIHVTFATRGRPVINDITLEDALQVGLDREADIISSGCGYPGLLLNHTTVDFKQKFDQADLIIAKGQGNYEGLWNIKDPRLFFILRVKCDRIAQSIGTQKGALVLKQKL